MRRAIITAVAAGAIGAAALLGPAGAFASPGTASAGGTTLHFTAHFTHGSIVDAAPVGPSAGDQQVVVGTLTQASQVAGRFGFVCEFLTASTSTTEACQGTGRLGGGSIVVGGASQMNTQDHTWAVVGGTGKYRGATGQVLIHDIDDHTSEVTVELG